MLVSIVVSEERETLRTERRRVRKSKEKEMTRHGQGWLKDVLFSSPKEAELAYHGQLGFSARALALRWAGHLGACGGEVRHVARGSIGNAVDWLRRR